MVKTTHIGHISQESSLPVPSSFSIYFHDRLIMLSGDAKPCTTLARISSDHVSGVLDGYQTAYGALCEVDTFFSTGVFNLAPAHFVGGVYISSQLVESLLGKEYAKKVEKFQPGGFLLGIPKCPSYGFLWTIDSASNLLPSGYATHPGMWSLHQAIDDYLAGDFSTRIVDVALQGGGLLVGVVLDREPATSAILRLPLKDILSGWLTTGQIGACKPTNAMPEDVVIRNQESGNRPTWCLQKIAPVQWREGLAVCAVREQDAVAPRTRLAIVETYPKRTRELAVFDLDIPEAVVVGMRAWRANAGSSVDTLLTVRYDKETLVTSLVAARLPLA